MTDDTAALDAAIAELYSGSLDEFIRRRDALAKQLRATGTREQAAAVKALRKPSRTAWSLNRAAADNPESLAELGAAVNAVVHSQSTGGDVRGAMASLRTTVRRLAGDAADAAALAGQRLDASDIANAVLAIVAVPQSFADLSRGVLVDVPEAGGLDFLASIAPLPTQSEAPRARIAPEPARTTSPERVAINAEAVRAASALETARGRARLAQQSLREAEAALRAAEAKLREAESAANEARGRFERAQADAEQAAIREREAEEECRKHD